MQAFLLDDRLHHTGKGKGETLKDSLTVAIHILTWRSTVRESFRVSPFPFPV